MDKEQAQAIKSQLLKQVESLPQDEAEQLKEQIENMYEKEFEEFLIKNKLIGKQECPFCLIAQGKIPSTKITENEDALAVLEINHMSKGHVLVIPKRHTNKTSSSAMKLANIVAEKLLIELNPDDIEISSSSSSEHKLINVVPIYEGKKSERKKASQDELKELEKILKISKQEEKIEEKKINKEEKAEAKEKKEVKKEVLPKYPRRIP